MTFLLAIGFLALGANGAGASCAEIPSPRGALASEPIAFVGTVVDIWNEDRWVVAKVEEVWKGTDIPEYVEIRGGEKSGFFFGVGSSGDREYDDGSRYLFFPHDRQGAVMQDNACSATTRFGPRVEALRPDEVAEPVPGSKPRTVRWVWFLGIAALVGVGLFAVFRKYHRRHESSGF
jgi:hypothetical protein